MSAVLEAGGPGAVRTVTCVIPCYREQPARVERTVRSAVAVTGINLVMLVDDGSGVEWGSGLGDIAERTSTPTCHVAVVHLPENRGAAAAMNVGVDYLPDDAIVARLDVGDVFIADAKAQQLRAVLEGGVRASCSPHYDAVARRLFTPPPAWRTRIYKDGTFCICTAVFERRVWAGVDGFDESLRYGDDWDFAMRVQHHIGWSMFEQPTCEAGAFDDGHTKRADRTPELAARKTADTLRVLERGLALSHPDAARRRRPRR